MGDDDALGAIMLRYRGDLDYVLMPLHQLDSPPMLMIVLDDAVISGLLTIRRLPAV